MSQKLEQISIAADHAAIDLKKKIIESFTEIKWQNLGPDTPTSVDYPDFAAKVSELVSSGKIKRGVLLCGSGIGMSIAANKFPGVRAALVHSVETARLSRMHNDSNILCLGARVLEEDLALEIVQTWLTTDFSNEPRHCGRVDKIKKLEKDHCK